MNVLDLELAVVPYTLECMRNGIRIDQQYFTDLTNEFIAERDRINYQIDQYAGTHVNVKSPKQVVEMLHRLGFKVSSSDADTLAKWSHPAIDLIKECRHYQDLMDKFTTVLPKLADNNSRVHADIKTTRVVTGRWATANPNMLGIPVRSKAGRKIRKGFTAEEGWTLLSADYSQLEMRMAAHVSGDAELIGVFERGEDIHSATCQRMFGNVNKELRYAAKRTGFGVLYGISPKGLYDLFIGEGVTTFTEGDCANFIQFWFNAYPDVATCISNLTAFIRRNGWCEDMFGRRRLVPEVNSVLKSKNGTYHIREAGIRSGVNHVIGQSPASGTIKSAMAKLVPRLKEWRSIARPLLQIHDELLWEVREDSFYDVATEIKQVMESAVSLQVPLKVDTEVGSNWGEQVEINI